MTTIKDIARLSGYSIGTVSRVINHHPDVSEAARRKIENVIRQTGFQPNSNAKLLKKNAVSAITIVVKGMKNYFLETILEEAQELLRIHGESVHVVFLDELSNEVETALQICTDRKPKGLIFLGGNLDYFEKSFAEIQIPAVLIAADGSGLGFDNLSSFSTDDSAAAADAVGWLLDHGHRQIGIIGGSSLNKNGYVGTERMVGALRKLEEAGVPFDVDRCFEPCLFSAGEGYEAALRLFERAPEITGIFCLGDMVAVGAMRAAADRGMKVPEDISFIGFDGIDYANYSVPRLTTVQQDVKELARKGVEDLLLRISYSRKSVHEMVPYRILSGESTAIPEKI